MDLVYRGWDHYTDPSAPLTVEINFSPDWVTLLPGDTIVSLVGCSIVELWQWWPAQPIAAVMISVRGLDEDH